MGKDNSCSKSKLQIQRERMNEELINFNGDIEKALRTIENNIKVEEKVKWILGLYHEEIARIGGNLLITEKVLKLQAEECIDLSEYDKILKQKNIELGEEQFKDFKKQFIEKITPKISEKMQEYANVILERLNQVVNNYTFYSKSIQVESISAVGYSVHLTILFKCIIDIK